MSTYQRADGTVVCEYSDLIQYSCAHCTGAKNPLVDEVAAHGEAWDE